MIRCVVSQKRRLEVNGPGGVIESLQDWGAKGAPKRPGQWKRGRSAMELARAWLPAVAAGELPVEVRALLDSRAQLREFQPETVSAEHLTRLDSFRGEGRNHDLLLVGSAAAGRTVVAVEGKADEPFSDTIAATLKKALKRNGSNAPTRVRQLCAAIIGVNDDEQLLDAKGIGGIRYQLVHATAGTLIEAEAANAVQAVLLIHEFIGSVDEQTGQPLTRPERIERNARDLAAFTAALAGREPATPTGLLGPFRAPGGGLVPAGLPLWLGKATRVDANRLALSSSVETRQPWGFTAASLCSQRPDDLGCSPDPARA